MSSNGHNRKRGGKKARKKTRIVKIVNCILLLLCSAVPFILYNGQAFTSDGVLNVIVEFSTVLEWVKQRWFSPHSLFGLCYLLTMILTGFVDLIGLLFLVGDKILKRKIVVIISKTLLIISSIFYMFAAIINTAAFITITGATFLLYFTTELIKLICLVYLFVFFILNSKERGVTH